MDRDYRFLMLATDTESAGELEMICLDDEAAMLLAERFASRQPVEVWAGGRFLGRAEPSAAAAPAAEQGPDGLPESAPEASPSGAPDVEAAPRRRFWAGAWRRGA